MLVAWRQVGACPSEVIRRVAKHMQRSVETIRYTVKQFDQKHPDLAVFPDQTAPLAEELKQKIYQQYRRGASVESLAKRNNRTKTTIYRIINEMRAARIFELPLDFIHNEEFERRGAARAILGPMPKRQEAARKPRSPSGLPPYLAGTV